MNEEIKRAMTGMTKREKIIYLEARIGFINECLKFFQQGKQDLENELKRMQEEL
jgi:hypothetical protein